MVVATAVSALCGSEMHSYRGAGSATGNGGHEAAGTIFAVGPDVTTLKIGQRVGLSAVVGCGHCAYCAKGQYTWCPDRPRLWQYARRAHSDRSPRLSPVARYGAVGCRCIARRGWRGGALSYRHQSRRIPAIKTLAIFGVGPIGLGHILLQNHWGRQVIAIDISPVQLMSQKRRGPHH